MSPVQNTETKGKQRRTSYTWIIIILVLIVGWFCLRGCKPTTGKNISKPESMPKPLIEAIIKGDQKEVKRLLDTGTDVNTKKDDGTTALMEASYHGHIRIVEMLIAKGADINVQNSGGGTALMFAACSGNRGIVKALLEKGADRTAKTSADETALTFAATNGKSEIVEMLKTYGTQKVSGPATGKDAALIKAAKKGALEDVNRLLKEGANVNAWDEEDGTALMSAAMNGHAKIVRLLLDKRADVNAKTKSGIGVLLAAYSSRNIDVMKMLTEKGVDVNAKTADGMTVLLMASVDGNIEAVKLLLAKGADVNTACKGKTALFIASARGHGELAKLLKAHGAKETAELKPPTSKAGPGGNVIVIKSETYQKRIKALDHKMIAVCAKVTVKNIGKTDARNILVGIVKCEKNKWATLYEVLENGTCRIPHLSVNEKEECDLVVAGFPTYSFDDVLMRVIDENPPPRFEAGVISYDGAE